MSQPSTLSVPARRQHKMRLPRRHRSQCNVSAPVQRVHLQGTSGRTSLPSRSTSDQHRRRDIRWHRCCSPSCRQSKGRTVGHGPRTVQRDMRCFRCGAVRSRSPGHFASESNWMKPPARNHNCFHSRSSMRPCCRTATCSNHTVVDAQRAHARARTQ